jgi:hypothetical protein
MRESQYIHAAFVAKITAISRQLSAFSNQLSKIQRFENSIFEIGRMLTTPVRKLRLIADS